MSSEADLFDALVEEWENVQYDAWQRASSVSSATDKDGNSLSEIQADDLMRQCRIVNLLNEDGDDVFTGSFQMWLSEVAEGRPDFDTWVADYRLEQAEIRADRKSERGI